MAIVTYPLNGIDYDAENAETYLCTRTSGVYSADGNFQASVTGDRQVSISAGLAWIQNTQFAGKSVCNTKPVAIEIPMADGTRPRIDRIVLKFDKASNRSEIVLKQGLPSSAPAAPSVERTELIYELGLCTVYVKAGSTIVDVGDITSTLLDESVCGLMRDGVTGIPTAQLQEQVNALIDDLREVIAGVEAGTEMMLKAVYDPREFARDIFGDISYQYTALYKLDDWMDSGNPDYPYTQTVTLTSEIEGAPTVTENSKFYAEIGSPKTGIAETDDALRDALTVIAEGTTTSGAGTVTTLVREKPTTDIPVVWTLRTGG